MTREEVLQALTRLNDAIASLNVRLHPPPMDSAERQELESELVAAENTRDTLEQALNNLPEPAPALTFAAGAEFPMRANHFRMQNQAAIEMSKLARQYADDLATLVEPVTGPVASGGIKPPKTKKAGGS